MPQPIALGTVLGGRYQVTASLLTSARGHVLQGDDEILRRRVSIVVPDEAHEHTLIANARKLAAEPGIDHFQVLDLGQTEDATYLVTSYAPAADLLHTLLDSDDDHEDHSLSDDIFGDTRTAPMSAYVYDQEDTSPQHRSDTPEPEEAATSAVTRWDEDDYSAYEDAPAAPSVRNRLGMARKVRRDTTRTTMFDRAAAGGSTAAVGASAAAASKIDPTYDGDNHYRDLSEDEGRVEDLTGYPVVEDETPGTDASGAAAVPAAAAITAEAEAHGEEPGPSSHHGHTPPPGDQDDYEDTRRRRGLWVGLVLLLLTALLVAAAFLGFSALSSLTAQFGPDRAARAPQTEQTTADPSSSPSTGPAPQVQSVSRVSSDPAFMADTDATLGQAIDGNPATYWLSYGFADPAFGGLVENIGLAVQLEQPAPVSEVSLEQSGGSGGSFTVYVSDSPALDGAQQVGSGSFTGPQITVPLDEAARSQPHQYVLVVWDQLPQLTEPIGGYPYGLRIGEVTVR